MTQLTSQVLSKIYGIKVTPKIEEYVKYFNDLMPKYNINTIDEQRHFLSQVGHESGRLVYVEEIASGKAYEGRKDLGNTNPGDGVRYKGRGIVQITGRFNYEILSKDLGYDFIKEPEKLKEIKWAVESACWFWKKNRINDLVQDSEESVKKITKKINGGLNGFQDRLDLYTKAKQYLK